MENNLESITEDEKISSVSPKSKKTYFVAITIFILFLCALVYVWARLSSDSLLLVSPQGTPSAKIGNNSESVTAEKKEDYNLNNFSTTLSTEVLIQEGAFAFVVDPATGEESTFRPSEEYTSTGRPRWSLNGKWLAYAYTVADPDYADTVLLNVFSYEEWKDKRFPNSKRVLVGASGVDYTWLPDDTLLIMQLLGKGQGEGGSYANATWSIYNPALDIFEYPFKPDPYIPNVYNIGVSSGDQKFIRLERPSAFGGRVEEIRLVDGTLLVASEMK